MAKSPIKKKLQQPTTIENLISLTNWLIGKKVNIDVLKSDTSNTSNYKYKLFSYLLKHPRLIVYLNNHLNGIYTFDKYSFSDWLDTFKIVFQRFNITSTNNIYISKFKPAKRISIKDNILNYYNLTYDKLLSNNELNDIIRLVDHNIISSETIENFKNCIDGKAGKVSSNIPIVTTNEVQKASFNSEPIINFNNNIISYIRSRVLCKNCPLFGGEIHPIISNLENDNKDALDVIIVGDFPISNNFLSDEHQYLKALLNKYKLTYLATNLLLCKPLTNDIPNEAKTIANCKGVTEHIYKSFDSHFKILIGTNAKREFGIKGNMTKLNGEIINNHFILVNTSQMALYKAGILKLNEFLIKYAATKISRASIESGMKNANEIKFSSELNNYTLFDIKIVNEKVLYILVENETGDKKYITENISYPVYIKQGTFQQCEYIIDNCDLVTYVTQQQKMQLYQQMKRNLQQSLMI